MRVEFRCKRCGRDIQANFTRPGKTAQCQGCHFTQEIPDPNAQVAGGGGGGGGGAPQQPQAPPQPPRKSGSKAASGGMVQKLVVLAILAIAAFAAYKFGKGRFF